MKPLYHWASLLLLGAALPAQSALVLGPQTCRHPHNSGSIYLAPNSYLSADALRSRIAKSKFGLDEAAALRALQARYPALELERLKVRVIRCTVYFEAVDATGTPYLFDAESLERVDPEHRP